MILTNARILTLDPRNTGTIGAVETAGITATQHVARAVAGQTRTHIGGMILTNARILTLDPRATGKIGAVETAGITSTHPVARAVAGQTGPHIVAS